MTSVPPVRPHLLLYPVGVSVDKPAEEIDEDVVDPGMALMDEPIVGVERVVYDDVSMVDHALMRRYRYVYGSQDLPSNAARAILRPPFPAI